MFISVELRVAVEPIIDFKLLNCNITLALVNSFLNLMVLFRLVLYTPIYFQAVGRLSIIGASLRMIPASLGLLLCTGISGLIVQRSGKYVFLVWTGTLLALVDFALVGALMHRNIGVWELEICLVLIGLGIGLCIQTNITMVQVAVDTSFAATITLKLYFVQAISSVFGASVFSTIMQNYWLLSWPEPYLGMRWRWFYLCWRLD